MGTKNRILYLTFKYKIQTYIKMLMTILSLVLEPMFVNIYTIQTYMKMLMTILSLVLEPMLVNIYWIINKILFLGLVPQPCIKTLDHYWNYWNYENWNYENGLILNILMSICIACNTIFMYISFIIKTAE